MTPRSLLPAGHQEIVELLRVTAADVLARGVQLPVVGQERLSGTQVGEQFFQLLLVPGLGPVRLQIGTGGIHVSPPQTPLHLPQEAFLGQVAVTDAAAQPEGIDGFVQAARAAGVRHVVFLSSSSVVEPGAETDPIARRHQAVEQALERSGCAWTFVRPGAFATNALSWAPTIRAEGVVRLAYPRAESAPIHEADIAAVAVAALTGETLHGAAPVLTGPESLTRERHVTLISTAIGRDVRCVELTPEQARAGMARSMPPPFVDGLLRMWAATDGVPAPISDAVTRITGRPGRGFLPWARDHATAFRS